MTGFGPLSVGADGTPPEQSNPLPNRSSMPPMGTSKLPRPLSTQKPLPSPPIAQLVNLDSPPKAQRTLIDAYSESPTSTDWPIIHPENVPPRPSSRRSSLPASSNIALGTPSPYDGTNETNEIHEADGTRVRRLSWHSTHSSASAGTGPTLRIAADANAIILGTDESIPEVPSIPAVIPTRLAQTRSMSTLASQGIRAMGSKTSLSSTPPSAKADRTETLRKVSTGVKISPIRSMQPPRNTGLEGYSSKSPSPLVASTVDRMTNGQANVATSRTAANTSSGSHEQIELASSASHPKPVASDLAAVPKVVGQTTEDNQKVVEPVVVPEDEQDLTIQRLRKSVNSLTMTPSLGSTVRSDNYDQNFNPNATDHASSSMPRTARSYSTAHTMDPHKLRVPEPITSKAIGSSVSFDIPQRRQSFESDDRSCVSPTDPSPLEEASSKKVKPQRSLRNLFSRDKSHVDLTESLPAKPGIMSAARSSLANAMRNSRSRSRIHLPWSGESKPETETEPVRPKSRRRDPPMPLTAFKFAGTTASPTREFIPDNSERMRNAVLNVLERAQREPDDAPHRERDLQVAECVVRAAESCRDANTCAVEAKKNSRDAEIHADRAGVEFMRLYGMLEEAGLDEETVRTIKTVLTRCAIFNPQRL